MKFSLCFLCLVAVLAFAFAESDAGYFIPKGFYTLDPNGHKSNFYAVNPHTAHYLRRFRRQLVSSSVSASSSSVTGNDGITYFSSQTLNSHTPQVDFSSRFGGSDDSLTSGHVVQTTGVIDKSGKVYYNTHEDHF